MCDITKTAGHRLERTLPFRANGLTLQGNIQNVQMQHLLIIAKTVSDLGRVYNWGLQKSNAAVPLQCEMICHH